MSQKIWKTIPEFENYEVSNHAEVRRIGSTTLKTITIEKRKGYSVVQLWKNNKGRTFFLHRLVGQAFVEGDQSLTIDHKDTNKQNNLPSNLEYVTRAVNTERQHAEGLASDVTQFKHTKIMPDQYECIIQRYDEGEPCWFIALDYDCERTLINWIVREPKLA